MLLAYELAKGIHKKLNVTYYQCKHKGIYTLLNVNIFKIIQKMIQKSYEILKSLSFRETDLENTKVSILTLVYMQYVEKIVKTCLYVSVNGSMSHSASGNSPQLTTVRRELRQIRDRVTQLLDQLEVGENVISSSVDSKRAPANKGQQLLLLFHLYSV